MSSEYSQPADSIGVSEVTVSAVEFDGEPIVIAQAGPGPVTTTQGGVPAIPAEVTPDQNNVVHLPAGVTIDQLRVQGADLILVQADGSEIRVVNAALNIPTFVIDGIEITREVVIAVLEENGIAVAAGPGDVISVVGSGPQGSGANFQDAQAGLGGGDPTFLALLTDAGDGNGAPDGDDEVMLDTVPDRGVSFLPADNLTVLESNLPGGTAALPEGARSSVGTLAFEVLDGVSAILINGIAVTGAGQAITGQFGTLTIVSVSDTGLQYSYQLSGPTSGDDNTESFTVEIIDTDLDSRTTTIGISITDDIPQVSANGDIQFDDDLLSGNAGLPANPIDGAGDDDIATAGAPGPFAGSLGLAFGADGGSVEWLTNVDTSGGASGLTYEIDPVTGTSLLIRQNGVTVITVTLDAATGSYTITQNAPLAHADGDGENNQSFTLTYRVTDGDGDTVDGTLVINIDDDVPVTSFNETVRLDDDVFAVLSLPGSGDDANAENTTGTLAHSAGADGVASVLLTAPDLPTGLGLSYVLSTDGTVLTISQLQEGVSVDVLRIALGDAASGGDTTSGDYTVTQLAAIDHPAGGNENNVQFTINYEVTDSDGDVTPGTLTVDVDDDEPLAIGTILPRYVEEEDGLPGGIEDTRGPIFGGDGDIDLGWLGTIDVTTRSTGGPLNIGWGGDRRDEDGRNDGTGRSVYFTNTANAAANVRVADGAGNPVSLTNLRSNGEPLTFELSQGNTRLIAYDAWDNPVFTVRITDDIDGLSSGSYDFILQGRLDHPGAGEDELRFTFSFTAEDSDGDTMDAGFEVRVIDDEPVAGGIGDNSLVILDDDDVAGAGGIAGGTGDDDTQNQAGFLVHGFGADGGSIALSAPDLPTNGGFSYVLVSSTQIIVRQQQGADTVDVLRFTIDADSGAYLAEQLATILHGSGSDENNRNFTFNYRVTDFDGDTADGAIRVRVDDDTPTAGGANDHDRIILDDDDVVNADGNAGGTADEEPAFAKGFLVHDFGADGGSLSLIAPDLPAGGGFSYVSAGSTQVVIRQTQGPATVDVLSITINPETGAYEVVQLAAIRHGNGGDENNRNFTINYRVTDGDGDTADGAIRLRVNDDTPEGTDDTLTLSEDAGPTTGTVANDSFGADGQRANNPYTVVSGVSNGTLAFNRADGTYTYTPDADYNGPDSFTYTITDADGDTSAPITVSITVTAVNDRPVANADSASTTEDTALAVSAANGVLRNDTDVDAGDVLSVVAGTYTTSCGGTIVFATDGSYVYTPPLNFYGVDSVDYMISDQAGLQSTSTLSINVSAVNDSPTIEAAPGVTTNEDTMVQLTGLRFDDVDSGYLTVTLLAPRGGFSASGSGGVSVINMGSAIQLIGSPSAINTYIADGKLRYTPASNDDADVTISFEVYDGQASSTGSFVIDVTPVNDPAMISGPGTGSVSEDTNVQIDVLNYLVASGTLSVTDVDAGEAGFQVQTDVATTYGTFSIEANGAWTYRINNDSAAVQGLGANGALTDTVTVWSIDGTASKFVTVTINGQNDGPTGISFSTTDIDELLPSQYWTGKTVATLTAVDADSTDTHTYTLLNNPFGLFQIQGNEIKTNPGMGFAFDYESGSFGRTFDLQIEVRDSSGASHIIEQTLTLTNVNELPLANNDEPADDMLATDAPTLFNVRANDVVDPDAGATNHITVGTPLILHGGDYGIGADDLLLEVIGGSIRVTLVGDGWKTIPDGQDALIRIPYQLHGNGTDESAAYLEFRVRGLNDAPAIRDLDEATFVENGALATIDADVTVTDPDSGNFSGGFLRITGYETTDQIVLRALGTGAGQFSFVGSNLHYQGVQIGTFQETFGTARNINFSFNTNATPAVVEALIENLTFRSLSENPATTRTVTLEINDGDGGAASSTTDVIINVTRLNDTPQVIEQSGLMDEDYTAFQVGLLTGASDADGDVMNAVDPAQQIRTIGGRELLIDIHYTVTGNVFTVTPAGFALFQDLAEGATDDFTFGYSISDGTVSVPNTVEVRVTGTNDAPVADNLTQTRSMDEDGAAIALFGTTPSVTDVDNGASVTATLRLATATGALTLTGGFTSTTASGTDTLYTITGTPAEVQAKLALVQYDSAQNYHGEATVAVSISDGISGAQPAGTVTITVASVNDAPVAVDDDLSSIVVDFNALPNNFQVQSGYAGFNWTTAQGGFEGPLYINTSQGGIINRSAGKISDFTSLQGDFDLISLDIVDAGRAYKVRIEGWDDGAVVGYRDVTLTGSIQTVDLGFSSIDQIRVTVLEGGWTYGSTVSGSWRIDNLTIARPVTDEDGVYTIQTSSLLRNDSDAENDTLTVSSVADETALGGAVILNSDGTITYNPGGALQHLAAGEVVEDSFEYTVSDGQGGYDTATARFQVKGVNDAPTAEFLTQSREVVEDAAPIALFATTPSVTDVDNGAFVTATLQLATAAGALTLAGGFSSTTASGTDTLYTITGTPAEVQAKLALVQYDSAQDFHGTVEVTVSVGDGIAAPVTGTVTVTVTPYPELTGHVYESELSAATFDRTTGTQAGNSDDKNGVAGLDDTIASDSFSSLVPGGAGGVSLTASNLDASLTGLTARGLPLTYSVSGNTLTATSQFATVFTFSIDPAARTYTFTLQGELDHPAGSDLLSLNLGSAILVEGVGTLPANLVIVVHDDMPIITGPAATGSVSEQELPYAAVHYNSLPILFGADRNGTIDFKTVNGQPVHPGGLTSDGVALEYALRTTEPANEKQLVAYKGEGRTEDDIVFVVALAPSSPTYFFTLLKPLDHTAETGNPIELEFTVVAKDRDGDAGEEVTFNVEVSSNFSPVLAGSNDLDALQEDSGSNPGTSVAKLLRMHDGPPSNDFATDADGSIKGIAVVNVTIDGGEWQYSTDGGANWSALAGTPVQARLLALDWLVRFVPGPNVNDGNILTPPAIQFHAWDGADGASAGDAVDISALGSIGATTAYSSGQHTAGISISAVNDAPEIVGLGGTAEYVEGTAGVVIDGNLTITDVDNSYLQGATVQIALNYVQGEDILIFANTASITGTFNAVTGILTLSGNATLAEYEAALASVRYQNVSETPSTADREITFSVFDGAVYSDFRSVTVTVTPVDDGPTAVNDQVTINDDGSVHITFTTYGNASYDASAGAYVITPALHNQIGALWSDTKVNLNDAFTITAQLYFGATNGADGFSFVIQDQAKGALGTPGGGLGYGDFEAMPGILNSIAVEFDTYQNTELGDPAADHMAINTNGQMNGTGAVSLPEIENNAWYNVTVTWDPGNGSGGTLTAVLRVGVTNYTVSKSGIDLDALGLVDQAYIGFTGSTGGQFNLQQIRDLNSEGSSGSFVFDVLQNDTSATPGDTLTLVGTPTILNGAGGTVAFTADGTAIVYTAGDAFRHLAAGETAIVEIEYTVQDSQGTSTAIATVTVKGQNDAPGLTGLDDATFMENTVNAAPQFIDANVSFGDLDSANLAGGVLEVTGMLIGEDTVGIRHQGDAAGQIGLDGMNVTFGGTVIGTATFLLGIFRVNFNANATPTAVDALIQNLTYANSSDSPIESRTLTITVTDGDGGTVSATTEITVTQELDVQPAVANHDTLSIAPAGWTLNLANGHIYKFFDGTYHWQQAFDAADDEVAGAYLATLTSLAEHGLVDALIPGDHRAHLGGSDAAVEGEWRWVAGPEAGTLFWLGDETGSAQGGAFANWNPGDPNNLSGPGGGTAAESYLAMNHLGRWIDVNESNSGLPADFGYVAEAGAPGAIYGAVTEDAPFTFSADLLLANDTNAAGGILSVGNAQGESTKGAMVSYNAGQITYDASGSAALAALAAGETTTDTFTYTIDNGAGGTSTATVTITVAGINDAPTLTGTNTLAYTFVPPSANEGTDIEDVPDMQESPFTAAMTSGPDGILQAGDLLLSNLVGTEGDDILIGGADNDMLVGAAGNDLLDGGTGNDTLVGEAGSDRLAGGSGLNVLTGGTEADTFVIDSSALIEIEMVDIITDYSLAEGDQIDLGALLQNVLGEQPLEMPAVSLSSGGALTVCTDQGDAISIAQLTNAPTAVMILYGNDQELRVDAAAV